jgi:hypothetical protein
MAASEITVVEPFVESAYTKTEGIAGFDIVYPEELPSLSERLRPS